MNKKKVVLLGLTGTGLTTLFNKLTNSNEKSGAAGEPVTKQIVLASTKYGKGFNIIDTPVFGAYEDKLLHTAGILTALSYQKGNRILVIVKYDRIREIIQGLENIIKPLNRFIELVTVIINHWDCSENQEQYKQELKGHIKNEFKIDSILFVSTINDSPKSICDEIERILSVHQTESEVRLIESEIYNNFDFVEMDDDFEQCEFFSMQAANIETKFQNEIYRLFKKFINDLTSDHPYFLEILQQVTQSIKLEAEKLVVQYEMKNGDKLLNLADKYGNNLAFIHYIEMKKQIQKMVDDIIMLALKKMKQHQNHFFNCLRKCQYCGEIWLKGGCEGATTCGERVTGDKDDENWVSPRVMVQIQIIVNKNGSIDFTVQVIIPDPNYRWINILYSLSYEKIISKAFPLVSTLESVMLSKATKQQYLDFVDKNANGLQLLKQEYKENFESSVVLNKD